MEPPLSLSGQLLLAFPGIGDPRFHHAVIAICAHDAKGALGIGVGRLIPRLRLHGLLDQLDIPVGCAPDAPVYLGGPVEPQRGFVLHSQDWHGEDTLRIGGRWALTSTLDILRAIAEGAGPARWLCALGYAGWGEGQLDEELTRHGWFATPGDDDLVFTATAAERWTAAFAGAGIDTRLLAASAGHA
jgi:putative transcriptional regulator